MELSSSDIKQSFMFSQKILCFSHISGNKNSEKSFFIFRKAENLKNSLSFRKRNFSYTSGKVYSEP